MSVPEPAAALVVGCDDLDEAIASCRQAGFRLDAIGPADDPTWAEMSRRGLRIVVDTTVDAGPPRLRLPADDEDIEDAEHTNLPAEVAGLPVERAPEPTGPVIPPSVPVLTVVHERDGDWNPGRADMRYRDLLPTRYGGAYIASHIHVPAGGPVPDYVHHHDIAHQLIYCHRGWVEVVYQDQGPPFVLRPGDCVLQPPGIRHRVLESSDDLYVVEIGSPAVHRTSVDHELELPNQGLEPTRRYGGQRFVRHIADDAPWSDGPAAGLQYQDTGLGQASDGQVSVRRVRTSGTAASWDLAHDRDLRLLFVTSGQVSLRRSDGAETVTESLTEGSSLALPAGQQAWLEQPSPDLTVLDVQAPGFSD